jgi:cell wall-associated NlpC family hydrolase
MTFPDKQLAIVKKMIQTDVATTLITKGRIDKALSVLKSRVHRTPYVFSGATPAAWDCSGLSMWFADQLGYQIPHSANKQAKIGTVVKTPQPGDLVLFGYKNSNTFFHASVYIGDGKVIHAGFRKGQRTSVLPLTSPSVKNTKIRFIRLG